MSSCFCRCGKRIDPCLNYCSWQCHVDEAKASGALANQPNGLPIRCIKADGSMWEHEHADHPDYKFPVTVTYVGPKQELPEWDDTYGDQTHALLYTDGCIVVTLYEHSYSTWGNDGLIRAGNMWKEGEWRLTDESIKKITEMKR